MQTITLAEFPQAPLPAMTLCEDGNGLVEVRLCVELERLTSEDRWRIVRATADELAVYVGGSKNGITAIVTADQWKDWRDWLGQSRYAEQLQKEATDYADSRREWCEVW